MLKKIMFYLLIFAFGFIGVKQNFAQSNELKLKRMQEHQKIKNLLNLKLANSKSNKSGKKSNSPKKYLKEGLLSKTNAESDRKSLFMNGNNVAVEIENYGGIGPGFGGIREITNLIWRGAPYIFQFCPIVGASVLDTAGIRRHIISDGMNDYDRTGLREIDPATGLKWQWQPLPGYADPDQPNIASNPAFDSDRDGKPDSWPREWYNSTLGEYVWPGYLVQGQNNADLEAFWAMDDRNNKEFAYFPYVNDSSKQGLGVQVEGRAFQWSNSLAANAVFFVWSITNISDKALDSVVFGIYGDPDIGGSDNDDDNGLFIPPFDTTVALYARNMVYFFDPDGVGDRGKKLGYLGCKFLESPGKIDGIDNDGDGMIDERQDDGIDNDGDWNIETDDVGIDGIANTGDFGEGDGKPTAGSRTADNRPNPLTPGEPNFEYTDLDESDQIGLTSFKSSQWATDLKIAEDEVMWNATKPGNFSEITQDEDIVFVYGSGYISLNPGETKRISMVFLFGEDLDDLLITAETVQDIYNKNYQFFKPPKLPNLTAIPGDKKVTLYWDSSAEESLDPITGKDFEGYVIYRSTRPDFSDIQNITDGKGSKFLYEPLKDSKGFEAKWDLENDWRGYHPVPYLGRGLNYYLGDNSGLQHTFVDFNNVINGQTYYYAVVAYDHGDSAGIPPSETTKKISLDPITGKLRYDVNTVGVVPGPRANGYIKPAINDNNVLHSSGVANGTVDFYIINDLEVADNTYTLTFSNKMNVDGREVTKKNYSVKGDASIKEKVTLYGTKFAQLSKTNIINDDYLSVTDEQGKKYNLNSDYEINFSKGAIKRTDNSSMADNSTYTIKYNYYSIYQSTALNGKDSNPVFEGIKLILNDYDKLDIDTKRSKWVNGNIEIPYKAGISSIGIRKVKYPGDYLITFSNENISTARKVVSGKLIDIPVNFKVEEVSTGISKPVVTLLNERAKNDSAWTRGDEIIFFKPNAKGTITDTLTWGFTLAVASKNDSLVPGNGDVFALYTKRPFTPNDVYTLNTKAGKISQKLTSDILDKIYVVPNPYVGENNIEPANRLQGQNRGERRIYFENLPQKCSIRIFTISGELVQTIEHESGMENGQETWNLLNEDGFSVAYGVYLAHIDAPGIGEKIVKFALIK
ncbi:MAG: hypothetical protein CR986_06260 [Ignavibacteriae bacterium]|nr:MAG: hypothetical protein CR986_06260 [Ignavibacteriota bacterium]